MDLRGESGRDPGAWADATEVSVEISVWVRRDVADPRDAARELLLDAGAQLLGLPRTDLGIWHDDGGRPWVKTASGERLAVSVSHCDGIAVVAASRTMQVGVDVEPLRAVPVTAMARRWFRPEEASWVAAQPDPALAFLRLWTAKEAVGKALGTGLRQEGLRRAVPLPSGDLSVPEPVPGETGLAVGHPDVPGVVLAVAGAGQTTPRFNTVVHDSASRSTERSRTSLPVVVRGN